MSRRREEQEQKSTADWMTTYSDMVTLLFAFFVLLFAISNVDQAKASLLFAGLGREGITDEQFTIINQMFGITGVGSEEEGWDFSGPEPNPDEGEEGEEGEPSELDVLYELIGLYVTEHGLENSIKVIHSGEHLLLTLANDIWFASGSADVTTGMRENAAMLAGLLQQTYNPEKPFIVFVDGHTDNVPIHTVQFPSNWELSAHRAFNFLRILINESELPQGYFSMRGWGEARPIATNETSEGKQLNRRVEILISQQRERPEHGLIPTPDYADRS